jgi:hypothetical protein
VKEYLELETDEQLSKYYESIVTAIGKGDFAVLHEHKSTCAICKSGHSVEINNMLSSGMTHTNVQTWCENNNMIFTKQEISKHKLMLPLMVALQINRQEKHSELSTMQTDILWLMKKSDQARAEHLLKMWEALLPKFLEQLMVMMDDPTVPFTAVVNAYEKVVDLAMKVNFAINPAGETDGNKGTGRGNTAAAIIGGEGVVGAIIGAWAEKAKEAAETTKES